MSEATLFPLPQAGVASFTGPDRKEVLQGLLTGDLSKLSSSHPVPSCVLTVHGKLVAHFWLFDRGADIAAVSLDRGAPARVVQALSKHLGLSDTEARDVSAETAVFFAPTPPAPAVVEGVFSAPAALLGVDGWVVLASAQGAAPLPGVSQEPGRLESLRVRHSVPLYGVDVGPDNYPAEAGLLPYVSDDKGCYLGQETTARLKFKGKPPKKLCLFRTDQRVSAGDAVTAAGQDAGRVTSAAAGPGGGGFFSLALLPTDAAGAPGPFTVGGRTAALIPPLEGKVQA